MANALRYHVELDLSQKDTSHAYLIRLTGRNKHVLEVGPATGYVTKILQQRGCRVSCIEYDPEAAEVAAEFCERMVVGNVETLDLKSAFRKQRFDVVTFGDVLEHLLDPAAVLLRVKDLLTPGGYVVASVPNVAHASIRLSLLRGSFQYTDAGLLDRTHLRFFTRESLAALFDEAGYQVHTWRRVLADPFVTEMQLQEQDYPACLAEAARSDIEALTYQFVVKAYPDEPSPNGRSRPALGACPENNLLDGLWRFQSKLDEQAGALASANAALAAHEERLRQLDRSLEEANERLDAIYASRGYRLLEGYRGQVRGLIPPDSRRSDLYQKAANIAAKLAGARGTKRRDDRRSGGDA
jgi:2-polyprenyl-3-methyl-5-hydroxy-6-metoxy-1,4-benzoquinol methylase